MTQSLHLTKFRLAFLFIAVGFLAVSCGSYQQASYYDNDGIYSNQNRTVSVERAPQRVQQNQNVEPSAYSNYFGQKAQEYNEILDSEVFTDIDSYASDVQNDSTVANQLTDYYDSDNDYQGNAGWGDNTENVVVNIYDNGWNNWGWGGAGFGFGGFGGYGFNNWGWGGNGWGGYGYGWNRWNRWNRWNNWGWGGYGWGGYGYAYGYGWCPTFGYNSYYANRGFAFNNSRRGYTGRNIIAANGRVNTSRGRSNLTASRANTSRGRSTTGRSLANRTARSSQTGRSNASARGIASRRTVGVDRNRAYRTSRSTRATPRSNSSASRSNPYYRSTTPRSSGYRSGSTGSRTNSRATRSTTPRTSTYRSSGSRTRSSGSYRSSSPSRSSSSTRSSRSSGSSRNYSTGRSSSSSRSYSSGRSSSSSRSSGSSRSSSSRSGSRNRN